MSASGHRLSQRQPKACLECTKTKRKCDKQIPCGRCVIRNIECTRETVRLRRTAKRDDELSFLEDLQLDLLQSPTIDPNILQKVTGRISALQSAGPGSVPVPDTNADAQRLEHHRSIDPFEYTAADTDSSVLTALEYMAWGRNSSSCFPHRRCTCRYRPKQALEASTAITANIDLPEINVARSLVNFHLKYLCWHHNCLHAPTFLDQCERFWSTGEVHHPQWISLYLAVLSCSTYCVCNSSTMKHRLGIEAGGVSAYHLFRDMLHVLSQANFLEDVSLYSIQAIVISTEVAHNLGFSQLNAVFFAAATRMAQCLGLHKIASQNSSRSRIDLDEAELIDVEIGKRVWNQMVIQDLFAIPFNDTHGIIPDHCSTEPPMNCDDDLVPRDEASLTISTYCRVLVKVAYLMPDLANGLGPLSKRKSLQQQYIQVLEMDRKMRDTVRQIPSILLREDFQDQAAAPSWLIIARRSLAITAADKIIMIHRPFLFRAFQSPTYAYTRRTCVAAATTILRQHEAITRSDDISIWTHTAFCITAAVILCFEILYCLKYTNEDVEPYRAAVSAARERLIARDQDVLAARGAALIDVVSHEGPVFARQLTEDSLTTASSTIIDLPRVIKKFVAVTRTDPPTESSEALWMTSPNDMIGDGNLEDPMDLLDFSTLPEFDEWYDETFTMGQGHFEDFSLQS